MTGKRTLERSIVRQLDAWLTDENNWMHADVDESGICEMPFLFKSDDGRYEIEGTAQSKWHRADGELEMEDVLWYELTTVRYYGEEIEITG